MDKKKSRGISGSYFAFTISISFVLFLVGMMLFLLLNARSMSSYVKENIGISIVIKDDAKLVDIKLLQKTLDSRKFVKETKFVSKDDAAKDFEKEVGVDFVEFIGGNPLMASIELKLKEEYTTPENVAKVEANLRKFDVVHDVYYQKSLVSEINKNVKKISIVLMTMSAIMLLISLTLIRNTVHMSVYSKRFVINTMQLVGAKPSFVRRPFIFRSCFFGLLAALLANLMLFGLLFLASKQMPSIIDFLSTKVILQLFLVIILLGIIITCISTFFAVNRYLRKNINDLYS